MKFLFGLLLATAVCVLPVSCSLAPAPVIPSAPASLESVASSSLIDGLSDPSRTLWLHSIHPWEGESDGTLAADERAAYGEIAGGVVGGYTILGSVALDPNQRVALLTALYRGIAEGPDYSAECFEPRHVLAIDGIDEVLVICFECNKLLVWNGEPIDTVSLSTAQRDHFNRVLDAAKIPRSQPIVPDEIEDEGDDGDDTEDDGFSVGG